MKELDSTKQRIIKAAEQFDAQELQKAWTKANELGMAQESLADAHQVFLKLQDGDFVEAKVVELQSSASTENEVIVLNLTTQLALLGLKIGNEGNRNVARSMSRRTVTSGSVFNKRRTESKASAMGQKLFMDLSNYSGLRDPITWGREGLAEHEEAETDPELCAIVMLQHDPEHLRQSLTNLAPAHEQAARKNFTNLLRCMGDKPSPVKGDLAEPIVKLAKKEKVLRDEVYVQLMKQLTDNPSTKSMLAGWELFHSLVKEELPTDELCEFLRGFLERSTNPDEHDDEEDEGEKGRAIRKSQKFEDTEARDNALVSTKALKEKVKEESEKTLKTFKEKWEKERAKKA